MAALPAGTLRTFRKSVAGPGTLVNVRKSASAVSSTARGTRRFRSVALISDANTMPSALLQ
jgi:hypothetical protein